MSENQKSNYKKFFNFVVGFFILILGIILVLSCWSEVVVLFKGVIGIILSLAGLLILYTLNKK